jgi:hypothetical protein
MHNLTVSLVFAGPDADMNSALPEILEIIKGYGGVTENIIREYSPEAD